MSHMRGSPRARGPPGAGTTRHNGGRRGPSLRAQSVLSGTGWCGGGIPEEPADDAAQSAHLGWGGVGEPGHHRSPERARAADPVGEVEGQLPPARPPGAPGACMSSRPMRRPHGRRRREHGTVRGGLRSRSPRRGLGGALGREGWWRRECRRWWPHGHQGRQLPPHLS